MEVTQNRTAAPRQAFTGPVMRLTALWALVESGLGGVLHAFHLPVTGVVVGGTAVVLISLIAHFAPHPRSILRATLLVLMVKAMVSPHSPLGAYVAVAFQGVGGWAIYSLAAPSLFVTTGFAVVALLESALQKLLMLTLFFGAPLWRAVDQWGQWVQQQVGMTALATDISFSQGLVVAYLDLHVVIALLIGWLAYRLPAALAREQITLAELEVLGETSSEPLAPKRTGKWWLVGAFLAALLYTLTTTDASSAWLAAGGYLLRTGLVLLVWYGWVGPALVHGVQRWLLRRRSAYAQELDTLLVWLPTFRRLARQHYTLLARQHRGMSLYRAWLLRIVALALVTNLPSHHA